MLKELATAIYYVGNIEQSKQWLKQVFDIEPYFDEPFYVGYNVNGYEMGVMPNESEQPVTYTKPTCYWRVENIDTSLAQLIDRGAELGDPAMDVGDGVKVGSVKDPFGNHFGIIENLHFDLTQK